VARQALGFLTVEAADALNDDGVVVLDPGSTLIAARAVLDAGVILYPNVTIECDDGGEIAVGAGTRLYPGCLLSARGGARIEIGARCELGPGIVHVHADGPAAEITLEDEVRLNHGAELSETSHLGRGAQILGPVIARSVTLADGLTLAVGEVRSCRTSFTQARIEQQSAYHPPA
jgi:carbonic anhydrase/acetyltransferase-like protein (isoleucine patch superfamily)